MKGTAEEDSVDGRLDDWSGPASSKVPVSTGSATSAAWAPID